AKAASGAGRRLELRNLPLRHRASLALEPDEHGNRRTAVPATALAMAPEYALGRACRHEADSAAKATTFELVTHAARMPASRSLQRDEAFLASPRRRLTEIRGRHRHA